MTIIERIENAVGAIIPIYSSGVDFSYSTEPERYAIYNITEQSVDFGDGKPQGTSYTVTVNVYTNQLSIPLYMEIKRAMSGAGFSPISGGEVMSSKFPAVTQYYLDFAGYDYG